MSYKRLLSAAIIISFIAMPLYAQAAEKAGMSCKKAGLTSTYQGKKYICIKSGKKLIWNKGVSIARPTALPIPTPSTTPTSVPIPTQTPITEPAAPTSFADLLQNYRGIPAAVWNEAQSLAAQGSPDL